MTPKIAPMIRRADVFVMVLLALAAAAVAVPASAGVDVERLPNLTFLSGLFAPRGHGPHVVLYPPAWPLAALPGRLTAGIFLGFHLAWGAAGMYLAAKRFGPGAAGALVAALAW